MPGNCAAGASYCYGHNTGNVGNVYEYSQCTWWAYVRRSEMKLPVGSYMGNGQDWGNTGRRLGYLVNTTPHVGAAISFRAGQNGSSAVYGHVAIVEQVLSDGSIVTSNCGKSMNGKIYYQTIRNAASGAYTYVHY